MECKQAQELISQWLDGALSADAVAQLQAHLALCPECQKTEQLLRTVQIDLQDFSLEPPAALHENVMRSIRAEKKKKTKSWIPAVSIVAAAAAVAILANAGLVALPGFGNNDAFRASIGSVSNPDASFAQNYAQAHGVTVLAIWSAQTPEALQTLSYTEENSVRIYSVSSELLSSLQETEHRTTVFEPDAPTDDATLAVLLFLK